MRRCLNIVLVIALFFAAAACTKTKHGECPAPKEDYTWFYVVETGVGSQSKCVLCDTAQDSTEANSCLYVYTENQTSWENKDQCRAEACSADPNTHDALQDSQGTWGTISPILNGDIPADDTRETVFSIAHTSVTSLPWKPNYPASRAMNALLDPAFYAQPDDTTHSR